MYWFSEWAVRLPWNLAPHIRFSSADAMTYFARQIRIFYSSRRSSQSCHVAVISSLVGRSTLQHPHLLCDRTNCITRGPKTPSRGFEYLSHCLWFACSLSLRFYNTCVLIHISQKNLRFYSAILLPVHEISKLSSLRRNLRIFASPSFRNIGRDIRKSKGMSNKNVLNGALCWHLSTGIPHLKHTSRVIKPSRVNSSRFTE